MSLQDDNKAIVGRWFTDFWGATCRLGVVDALHAWDQPVERLLEFGTEGGCAAADAAAGCAGRASARPSSAALVAGAREHTTTACNS